MTTTRRRRIVRRALLAFAVVALLPVWYLYGLVTLILVYQSGLLPPDMFYRQPLESYAVSLNWYLESDLPGKQAVDWIVVQSFEAGAQLHDAIHGPTSAIHEP